MKTINQTEMLKLDRLVVDGIDSLVSRGVQPREACRLAQEWVRKEFPRVAVAYAAWLATRGIEA